jgi:chromosome segregation ATPase
MSDDADIIRVPKERLREVKRQIDALQVERERLAGEVAEARRALQTLQQQHDGLREEHANLRAHLTGSLREIARLSEGADRPRG